MFRLLVLCCLCFAFTNLQAQLLDSTEVAELLQQPDSVIEQRIDSMTAQVEYLYGQGKYADAATVTHQQLVILENSLGNMHPAYGTSLNNLGVLNEKMGQYDKALSLYIKSLKFTRSSMGVEHPDYGNRLGNLGNLYQSMSRYEEALPVQLEALKNIRNNLGMEHPYFIIRLISLGYLYTLMGRYEEALPLYTQAIELTRNTLGDDHQLYSTGLNNLGFLYESTGRYNEALPLMQEALDNTRKRLGVEHPDYGSRLNNLGALYSSMRRYEKALPLYLEALEHTRKTLGSEHPEYGIRLNNLGSLYEKMERYSEALPLLLEALKNTRSSLGLKHQRYSIYMNNLSGLYQSMGQYEESIAYMVEVYHNRLNQIQNVFRISSEKNKADFLRSLSLDFDQMESLAWSTQYQFDTLNHLLYNNALLLNGLILESTTNTYTAIESSSDTALSNQFYTWKSIRQDLAEQYSKPIAKRTVNVDSLEKVANELEGELVRLSADFAEIRKQVVWHDVKRALANKELAIEFSSFRYIDGRDKTDSVLYTAMLVTPQSEVPTIVPLFEQKQLDALLGQSQDKTDEQYISQLYASRGGAGMGAATKQATSAELYKLIWKPLEKHLEGVERIYMAPSGKLHQTALHALPNEQGELMLNKYDLRYVNSTRVLVTGKEPDVSGKTFHAYGDINYNLTDNQWEKAVVQYQSDEPQEEDPLAALGFVIEKEAEYAVDARGTDRGNGWSALSGTGAEISSIAGLLDKKGWNTKNYTGGLALEEAIKTNTGILAPDVLHIATHGFFFPDVEEKGKGSVYRQSDDPMFRSGLIMAGGNRDWQQETLPKGVENGVLTAYEVAQLDLRNTDLVVLSACETGLGDVQGSEGVYGLQRAFKQAGANYLIISLWKVPDAQTVELMELFYKYWQKGQTIPEAFRKAQLKMSKKYSPFEWAAFKLVR